MSDFLLNDSCDAIIDGGDFATGDDLLQQQKILVQSLPGEFKENPLTGVGVMNFINDENITGLNTEIKRQFLSDGLKVNDVDFVNNELQIDAERN